MTLLRRGIVLLPRAMKSGMRRIPGVMPRITRTSPTKRKNISISSLNRFPPNLRHKSNL